MAGVVDVDGLADSMTPEQFTAWEVADEVVPLDHTERMLGLLVVMVGRYLGMDDLEPIAMPWLNTEHDQTAQVVASLRGGD